MNRLTGSSGTSDVVGMVLLLPALLGLALLVIWVGRQVDAQAQLRAVAGAAAHAGALERSPQQAEARARRTASAALVAADSCADPEISVDLSRFEPGGVITVGLACFANRGGLELITPPRVRLRASVEVAIDPYRSLDRP
jgi:hypothetical protein